MRKHDAEYSTTNHLRRTPGIGPVFRRVAAFASKAALPLMAALVSAAAAVAENPLPAGNAGVQAQMAGTVHVRQTGAVKIHSYVSPADGWLVNSQIVEGPTSLVIFDGQLLLPYAVEVAAYAERLGKPVNRIVLSHGHPDHWAGLQTLTERFPAAPVYALSGVADGLRAKGEAILTGARRAFGDRLASRVTIPSGVIAEGKQTIDGVNFEFRRVVDAESDLQLITLLPDQTTLLAFDLVFSPKDHLFTVAPHFDHWIAVLEDIRKIEGYDIVIIGHNAPVDRSAIDSTISYLLRAKEIYANAADAKAYANGLKAAFPERGQTGWIDFSSRHLYAGRK